MTHENAPSLTRARPTRAADPDQIRKLIRHLSSDNANEVFAAAQALVRALASVGKDVHDLADLTKQWDAEVAAQRLQEPKGPDPIDWPLVERIITRFAEGKTRFTVDRVMRAVITEIPEVDKRRGAERFALGGFARRCLIRLGFSMSRSGLSCERKSASGEEGR